MTRKSSSHGWSGWLKRNYLNNLILETNKKIKEKEEKKDGK